MSWNRRGIISILFCGGIVLVAGLSAVPVASTQNPAQAPTSCAAVKPAALSPAIPEKELHLDGVSGAFVQTFVDNFDAPTLDFGPSGAWTPNFGSGRQLVDSHTLRANGELEAFVDAAFPGTGAAPLGLNPFSMHGGFLTISANKTPDDKRAVLWGLPYTSGMISTVNGFAQTYGYFEMRARLPSGKGMWPAFWLLPKDGSWPPEIDVMEMLGDRPTRVYLTPHSFAGGKHSFHTMQTDLSDTSAAPHRFGVLWTSKELTWFVDRRPAASYPTPADMTKPMYLVATLAIGGTWPGSPDSSTCFPATMDIDFRHESSAHAEKAKKKHWKSTMDPS